MAGYHRVYDSRHVHVNCQEPGSAPEPYVRQSSMGCRFIVSYRTASTVHSRWRVLYDDGWQVMEVSLNVSFRKINGIDTIHDRFSADMLVEAAWREPRLDAPAAAAAAAAAAGDGHAHAQQVRATPTILRYCADQSSFICSIFTGCGCTWHRRSILMHKLLIVLSCSRQDL